MTELDKRLNAYRPDLADLRLKDKVAAERYAEGRPMQVAAPRGAGPPPPRADAMQLTEALMGERLRVFDDNAGWCFVQLDQDRYVGYVAAADLTDELRAATHLVAVPSTFLYPAPRLKSQPATVVTFNAQLTVAGGDDAFAMIADGRFVFRNHLRTAAEDLRDVVAVAERFLHVPYYWGGKSVHGIDCSGLIQLCLEACGYACPRDSDMQESSLGQPLLVNDLSTLRRGDLVFWDGHVGLMRDAATLIHANGHHMLTVAEPLADVVERIAATGKPVTAIRRLQ